MKHTAIFCLMLTTLISACTTTQTIPVPVGDNKCNIIHPEKPRAVYMDEVKIKVLSNKDLEKMASESKDSDMFYFISGGDYAALVKNVAEIKRFISQTNDVMEYYRSIGNQ